jgi:hypothetical protein
LVFELKPLALFIIIRREAKKNSLVPSTNDPKVQINKQNPTLNVVEIF